MMWRFGRRTFQEALAFYVAAARWSPCLGQHACGIGSLHGAAEYAILFLSALGDESR
jgi:hypothetical protein